MNKTCRLCLIVSSEKMCSLSEQYDVLAKIKECLSIEISLNELLPSQICSVCVNKIDDIHKYQKKVKDNQDVLSKLTIDLEQNKPNENSLLFDIKTDITENESDAIFERRSIKEMYSSSDDEVLSNSRMENKNEQQHKNKIKLEVTKISKPKLLEKNKHNLENLHHMCLMCFIDCKSQNDLVQHYNEHNKISSKDNEMLKSTGNVLKKYKTDTSEDGKVTYECCICCKSYDKNQDILKHVRSHQRPFLCKLCGRTYKTVYEIVRHGRAHNGELFHCSFRCGFSTVYKGALTNHEKRHSSPQFKFNCEKCGKGFQVKTWHDQHQNVHTGLKPFECDICGVAFHMDRYLTAHRSKMHPQSSLIKKHICVICSLPCDTRNTLKRHMEEHGVKSMLLCDLCGKVFTNSELLKYHKNSHLGVKPYSCSVCNKTFVKKFNLKMHVQTHSGERAHACSHSHCGKRFTQSSALRRHERRAPDTYSRSVDKTDVIKYHNKLQSQEKIALHSVAPR